LGRVGTALAAAVVVIVSSCGVGSGSSGGGGGSVAVHTRFPVLFVTQVPIPDDFTTVVSTFGNHMADPGRAPRGGDLWIRFPDGACKNLTEGAGFGMVGLQGANAVAVREPCVHWSGDKAVFSMILGSPGQFDPTQFRWQLYEVTGLGYSDQPVITRVPNQPANYNNVSPCYASDDRILFASDRPRDGSAHLFPQRDEYEEQPTNTGLWSLDPASGELFLLQHSPSGSFSPRVDSFGRVLFTRWDHLERDQQADDDRINTYLAGSTIYGTFNWSDESPGSTPTPSNVEVFPDPRNPWVGFVDSHPGYTGDMNGWSPDSVGNLFNHFFPWQINQDGTEEETLGHVGRHELHHYFNAGRDDDPNVVSFLGHTVFTANPRPVDNFFQIREDPLVPGEYFGIDAPEFYSHAAGQVVRLTAPPGLSPDAMNVDYITHRDTHTTTSTPSPNHSGLYRNPLPLSDGQWIASHTFATDRDANIGTGTQPRSRYDFRLRLLEFNGLTRVSGPELTPGLFKSVQWWSPNQLISYDGPLWELDAVEVRSRPVPPVPTPALGAPELQSLAEENVALPDLVAYLRGNGLALIVSRDVTTRDRNDRQQPFNLHVAGSTHQTVATGGRVYDLAHLQLFQGDLLRGLTFGTGIIAPGRRVIAQEMHDAMPDNPPNPTGPPGSVQIAPDGSVAALVPARRALSWQTVDPQGAPVVRERYWITFQPGEIRTCTSCHGLSSADQLGRPPPTNKPEALNLLLRHLRNNGSL
jgi:hypothetical protein